MVGYTIVQYLLDAPTFNLTFTLNFFLVTWVDIYFAGVKTIMIYFFPFFIYSTKLSLSLKHPCGDQRNQAERGISQAEGFSFHPLWAFPFPFFPTLFSGMADSAVDYPQSPLPVISPRLGIVLVCFSIAVIKHWPKLIREEKDLFHLLIHHEVSRSETLNREKKRRPERNAAYWLVLIQQRTTYQGVAPRTVRCILPHQ